MTNAEATTRSFAPDDWSALCGLYEPAARYELALSDTDPRAFRPLSEEEGLDEFQRLNTAMVACVDDLVVGSWRGETAESGAGAATCPGYTSIQLSIDVVSAID